MNRFLSFLFALFALSFLLPENVSAFTPDTLQMKEDIRVLSSDSLQGRKARSLGNIMARSYIVKRLSDLGYNVILDSFSTKDSLSLCNVYAVKKGKDADSKIVIGAHYDHLGVKDGEIYNGADDNASGVATVLQLAQAYSSMRKPNSSVIFALWDGEEIGIKGSIYYMKAHKGDSIAAYLNFDMVGRNSDEAKPWLVSFHFSSGKEYLKKLQMEAVEKYHLSLWPVYKEWDLRGGSDNISFAMNGIPCVWWHTDGHPDFHKPTDTEDKINYPKLQEIIKSAYYLSKKIAYGAKIR